MTGATLSGCVLTAAGGVATDVPVTLDSGDPVPTDENGCYSFSGLRPGPTTPSGPPTPRRASWAMRDREVLDGVDLALPDIQLPAAARLIGVVLHHGGWSRRTRSWSRRGAGHS